jgi:ribosomal protein S14
MSETESASSSRRQSNGAPSRLIASVGRAARAEFHRAGRRLHLSRGSLREIAEELGLPIGVLAASTDENTREALHLLRQGQCSGLRARLDR